MLEIQDVSIVFNQGTFDENKALKNINLKINFKTKNKLVYPI